MKYPKKEGPGSLSEKEVRSGLLDDRERERADQGPLTTNDKRVVGPHDKAEKPTTTTTTEGRARALREKVCLCSEP